LLLIVLVLTIGISPVHAAILADPAEHLGYGEPTNAPAIRDAVPQIVRDGAAHYVGHLTPGRVLRLIFTLQPPHPLQEERFLTEIRTKGSASFLRSFSPAEWNARFAPSIQDEQAVVTWAQAHHLRVAQRFSNRLAIVVDAKVADIEAAFNLKINNYRLDATTFFSVDRDPTIPAGLVGIVQSILGTDSWRTLSPVGEATLPVHATEQTVSLPGSHPIVGPSARSNGSRHRHIGPHVSVCGLQTCYDPANIYSPQAYNYAGLYSQGHCCNPFNNPSVSPPQTSIAIYGVGDVSFSDLGMFFGTYGLAFDINKVYVNGVVPSCAGPLVQGCDETTMDTEWSTAMANSFGSSSSTAAVYIYEAADSSLTSWYLALQRMLSDGKARTLSMSYGGSEFDLFGSNNMSAFDSLFGAMVNQGWTIVASSGDEGAYANCSTPSAAFPASDPFVIAAGGTFLSLNQQGTYLNEETWGTEPGTNYGCVPPNHNNGGGGGGCSGYWPTPSYQTNNICGGFRSLPDISLNADYTDAPQNVYFSGQWMPNGGTSIVAPEVAGFLAQEKAYLLGEGNRCGASGTQNCLSVGNAINAAIYNAGLGNARGLPPHNPFYDIAFGNNGGIGPNTGYDAGPGYDLATGWGSANMLQLAWAINWNLMADNGRPTVAFSGPAINRWYDSDQTVSWTIADSGGPFAASGVAGYSRQWDSDPGDPTSRTSPGCCGSFFGPQFPNATTGSVGLAGAGGQGCHTLHVRAWDNMGLPAIKHTGHCVTTRFRRRLQAPCPASRAVDPTWALYVLPSPPLIPAAAFPPPSTRSMEVAARITPHHSPYRRPALIP
jgi:subtilase family serine protease